MLNIEILARKFGLNQAELDELKNYDRDIRMMLYMLRHPNGSEIYVFGCHPLSDEVLGTVVSRVWTGDLYGETRPVHTDDLAASVPDRSFQRVSWDELKEKLQYRT